MAFSQVFRAAAASPALSKSTISDKLFIMFVFITFILLLEWMGFHVPVYRSFTDKITPNVRGLHRLAANTPLAGK